MKRLAIVGCVVVGLGWVGFSASEAASEAASVTASGELCIYAVHIRPDSVFVHWMPGACIPNFNWFGEPHYIDSSPRSGCMLIGNYPGIEQPAADTSWAYCPLPPAQTEPPQQGSRGAQG